MDVKFVIKLVHEGRIQWQRHALERMMERDISRRDVKQVLIEGELIEDYPLPSGLIHGFDNESPLHVVVAIDINIEWCYIITAYRPDSKHFEQDFKTRKK